MRTGQILWVGMKVDIVAGEYRGQRGIIRDVNRYQYNPRNPGKVSGLDVTLERLTMTTSGITCVKLDYDELHFHR